MAGPLRTTLATLLVAALCAAWFHVSRDRARDRVVDVDEGEWLSISIYTWQLATTGAARDAGAPRRKPAEDPWREGIQASTFGWMNPLFGKLVLGAACDLGGHRAATREVFPRFTRERPRARERALARFGPALRDGRRVTLALAAGCGALLFYAGWRAQGLLAGALAAGLWCASPAARAAAAYVRTDLFPVFFGLGALALCIAARGALSGARGAARAVLAGAGVGLLAGLAVGSKLNGAASAAVVAVAVPLAWALAPRASRGRFARGPLPALLAAGAVCLALACLALPAAWRANPLAGLAETVDAWAAATDVQQRKFARQGYAVAETVPEHVDLAVSGVLGREEPLRALTGVPLGAPLLLLGLVALAAGARAGPRRTAAALALAWALVTLAVQTLWLPIDWERWFLPYQPVLVLLEAVAVAAALALLARRPRAAAPLLLVLAAGCGGGPERPPDVLLVSLDTLRADRLSCYGYERPTSPRLDVLAAGGVRFETAVAPSVHTAPAHMSLFTGLDPLAHGVVNIRGAGVPVLRVAEEVPTLPERFRRAGYRTAAFCDLGNLLPAMGFDRGFDHARFYLEPMRRKARFLREWLDGQPDDRPLFVFFHTYATHAPYVPPRDLFGTFADEGYDGPIRARYEGLAGLGPGESRLDFSREFLATWEGFGEADRRFLSDLYDEAVLAADRELGDLWRQWSARRDPARTLLVVTSDHGELLGEGGEFGHRGGTRRELVSVPLILRGPGVGVGVQRSPVSLTGLGPTLCALAGAPPLEGQEPSFADLARDPALRRSAPRDAVVQLVGEGRAVNFDALHRAGLHLMRTESDGEIDLALEDWGGGAPTAEERARLLEALDARAAAGAARRAEAPPAPSRTPEEEELRNLEALGYLEADG